MSGLPAMDGTNVDWNAAPIERIKSIALCVVVVAALTFVLLKFKDVVLKKVAFFGSLVVTLLLGITLVSLCITTPIVEKKNDLSPTGLNDFVYSEDKNLIVLIIDATDSTPFLAKVQEDEETLAAFKDFTYYNDAAAMYPFTLHAIPGALTGEWYENDMPYREYIEASFQKSPLFNYLQQENYRMGLYNKSEVILPYNFKGMFENHLDVKAKFSNPISAAISIVKMSAIKYAPWDLKFYGYNLTDHLDDSKSTLYEGVKKNNRTFYAELNKENPITLTQEKCARILHIEAAHVPYRYDKNVQIKEDATYNDNIECTKTICVKFLEELKESGVYDNSVVVIMSDHGFDDEERGIHRDRANPAFLVKGINETGDKMKINTTPFSYEDLADGLVNLLKGEKTRDNVFAECTYPNGRRFIDYEYIDNTHMVECLIKKTAADWENTIPTGNVYDRK